MKKIAIIIDGGFIRKTFQKFFRTSEVPTVNQVIKLSEDIIKKPEEELFRIYYYDCLPFEKPLRKPVSKSKWRDNALVNTGKRYMDTLAIKDKIAFRSGELKFGGWVLDNKKINDIIAKKRNPVDDDFRPLFKQKRVDIKIGLDIAWLSVRRIVDRIILIAGDSDFVPAMKFARIEGIQIVVAPLRNRVNRDMCEHSDEIRDFDISSLRNII